MMCWEPISDKHKTGVLIVAVHKSDPEKTLLVRWDPEAEFDPDDPTMRAPDRFTHAFIVPAFDPDIPS